MTAPAPWTRRTVTWALDRQPIRSDAPTTRTLTGLLLEHPVWLVLTTIPDADTRAGVVDRIVEHRSPITDNLLRAVADELIHAWTGWPGWTTTRLWREALESWQATDGHALTRGVDLLDYAPDRATTTVYGILAERHASDKDKGDRWRRTLQAVPIDVTRREAKQPDTTAAQDWQQMATISRGMQT